MGNLVYTTSPLWIFMSTFIGLGFMILLGAVGLVAAFFRRKEKKFSRITMGCAGVFLGVFSMIGLAFTLLSIVSGAKTATVSLQQKTVARDNCGEGDTCTRYVLETMAGPITYDFTVEESAFNATQEGGCYRVTYYPNKSLFAPDYGTDQYIATSYVTRIEQIATTGCE